VEQPRHAGAVVSMSLAACSSTPSASPSTSVAASTATNSMPSTTSSTVSVAAVGQQVLSIISTNNAAIQAAKTQPGTSGFPAIATAFGTAAQQLQNLNYPANAQADAKALVAILEKLSVDASQASNAGAAIGAVAQNVSSDEGTERADQDALRHDLGLPPAPIPGG
jgi:hypothetical protein